MWLTDGFLDTFLGRLRRQCAYMLFMCRGDIHMWEILTCGGDIHVWQVLKCGRDIHMSELLTCRGDIQVWDLLTCVGRATPLKFFTS